ncbi:mitochondrial cytochrome c oxidase subunit VIa [Sanghuangporus baumii]|uniref:Mitochondrial cytochrome c oxidase subunit VIa n=1 Tax=Sanghuangporus baumii TaxID=108892 RepID=A0A9Q5HUD7_SANBA|nr:mitochondrial cytochrome c oxidase subunit VIa [Sanghuangporus baumii]
MLRTFSTTVARSAPSRAIRASRGFAAHAGQVEQLVLEGKPTKEWIEFKKNIEHHAEGRHSPFFFFEVQLFTTYLCSCATETTNLWRKISFFVAVPTTLLGTLWVYRVESEHAEHEAHIRAEHGGELPPVPAYDYLNKRAKPFPWGANSLFFNAHTNKDLTADA